MSIRDDFAAYTAPDGSLSGEKWPKAASGNSLMYSAEKLIALIQNGVSTGDDLRQFENIAQTRRILPGLFARTGVGAPYSKDQEAPDDYYGLVAVSPLIAQEVFEYGKRAKFLWAPLGFFLTIPFPYYFPTAGQDDHDVSAWFGRYFGFIAHLRICAGVTRWPWHSLAWAYSIALGPKAADQDSWIITWIMIWANKKPNWLEKQAVKIWHARMAAVWSGDIKKVFARYFNAPAGMAHPLAVWTR